MSYVSYKDEKKITHEEQEKEFLTRTKTYGINKLNERYENR